MSMGSQVSVFCKDVSNSEVFWTIQFEDGSYIKWCNDDDSEIFPLWSTESRVELTLKRAEEFSGGKPIAISLDTFKTEWLPDLIKNSVSIGPNWSGENLSGSSYEAEELLARIKNCNKST